MFDFSTVIEAAGDALRSSGSPALDARFEVQTVRRLTMIDGIVTESSQITMTAGSARRLGEPDVFIAVTDADDLRAAISEASRTTTERLALPERPPTIDHGDLGPAPAWPELDVAMQSLSRHFALARDAAPNLTSYRAFYVDQQRMVWYGSGEGTSLVQRFADASLITTVRTRRLDATGFAFVSVADQCPERVLEADATVRAAAEHAERLLTLPAVSPGPRDVILDPFVAGLFAHEAIGHLSEADYQHERPDVAELMRPGREIGPAALNVVDDPTRPALRGSYRYDDEGTPARWTYLVRDGRVAGRMHSRVTAAHFGAAPTGHGRALDARYPPLVRMSNTCILPGPDTVQDLFADVRDGLYVRRPMGGETRMSEFAFGANEVFRIRNGRLEGQVSPVLLVGDLFETFAAIDGIAGDLSFEHPAGGCAKEGQEPLPVDSGGPHVLIRRCMVVPL